MEQTVVKALAVLQALIRADRPQRLTDLAASLGMTKPNVFRLLGTLAGLGYAQQDESTSLYRPTLKVFELGSVLISRADLPGAAEEAMNRLAQASGESVVLGVFDNGYSVYVKTVDGPRPIKAVAAIGTRVPATCASTGKAILAWLPDAAVEATLPLLRKFTPLTKTQPAEVRRDLELTREQGYAVNRGEWRAGVAGVGAPVRDWRGNVVASVAVWGAEGEILGKAREAELAALTMAAANEVSVRLGYLSPRWPQADPHTGPGLTAKAPKRVGKTSARARVKQGRPPARAARSARTKGAAPVRS